MFAGAIIPLALAWLGDVVAYADRQPVIARFLSGQILGIVLGQAIGGAVTEVFGWRATLAVIGGFHLVAGLGMLFEMRRTPSTVADGRGQRLAASRIITATLDLLARPWVRTLLLIGFAEAIVFYGALAYVGSELRQRFGISAGTGGLMLACFGAGALIYAMTAARMISLLGQTGLALAGGAILAAAFLLLAVTPVLWLAPAGTAGLGLGFYMLHNTLQTNVTQMAPEARGLAVSQFAFWLFAGQSSGAALGGAIFDRYGGRPLFALAAVALPLVAIWFWRAMVRRQASGR